MRFVMRMAVAWFVVVSVVAPAIAVADNFGSTAGCGYEYGHSDDYVPPGSQLPVICISLANNKWHAARPYSFGNQWPGIDTAVQNSLSGDYNPTDLVAYWTTTDSLPDVRLWDWWYPQFPDLAAWVDCPADNTGIGHHALPGTPEYDSSRWCRGQIIRFNASVGASWNQLGRDWVACHELGHSVGLRHSTDNYSCMEPYPSNGVVDYLDADDISDINTHY